MKPGFRPDSRLGRERLLDTAVYLFACKDYDDVGLRELATRAGVNSSLVSFHFRDKLGLYGAAVDLACRSALAMAERFPPAPAAGDPESGTRAAQAILGTVRVLLEALRGPGSPPEEARVRQAALHRLFLKVLAHPRAPGRAQVLACARVHADHLDSCLRAAAPDLGPVALRRARASLSGQVVFLLDHQDLLEALGEAEEDLEGLARHITSFTLAGLAALEGPG